MLLYFAMLIDAPPCEEITSADLTAIEKVIEEIDHANFKRHVLKGITEWFLVLRMYRNLELSFLSQPCEVRGKVQHRHRAILTSIMSFGDVIDAIIQDVKDLELTAWGLSKEAVRANVKYLRDKYQQWYNPLTQQEAQKLFGHLLNECSTSS